MAMLCAALVFAGPASAQKNTGPEGGIPSGMGDLRRQQSLAPLVKAAAPAVVNVFSQRKVRQARPAMFEDPVFRQFFGNQFPEGMPRERVEQSLGSGVIVDPGGILVTNAHVIEGADEIIIALSDKREFEAKLLAKDPRSDLAVLKIDAGAEKLPYLQFGDSDRLEVGETVLAIGNPFGVGQTVTSGIVSALGRTGVGSLETQSFIQTDAAINPGNSGGALLSLDGRLAGINTAIVSASGGSLGISFAIPANLVASTVAAAAGGKGIMRPWLGVKGQDASAEIAGELGQPHSGGVAVLTLYPGGAADQGGIKTGDLIAKVDGHEIASHRELNFRIATHKPGEQASIEVLRHGQPVTLTVKLDRAPETPPRREQVLAGAHPLDGVTAGNLSPALAEELGVDAFLTGAVLTKVPQRSLAAKYGFRPGDGIESVNGEKIDDVAELIRALNGGRTRGFEMVIRRGERLLNLVVQR
jgi:serine protease Do